MKKGFRTPSLKKSISARTTGRISRTLKSSYTPFYNKKGTGIYKDPKKSIYNAVYSRTTVDSLKGVRSSTSKTFSKGDSEYYEDNEFGDVTSYGPYEYPYNYDIKRHYIKLENADEKLLKRIVHYNWMPLCVAIKPYQDKKKIKVFVERLDGHNNMPKTLIDAPLGEVPKKYIDELLEMDVRYCKAIVEKKLNNKTGEYSYIAKICYEERVKVEEDDGKEDYTDPKYSEDYIENTYNEIYGTDHTLRNCIITFVIAMLLIILLCNINRF